MGLINFFWRGVPAYFWVGAIYAAVALGFQTGTGGDSLALEARLATPFTQIPLLTGAPFHVSLNTVFIALGFVSIWVEVVRATRINDRGGNDIFSLLTTLAAILAFVGLPDFGTTAFLVVPLAGFGDLLLDRLVGQAVARRDFARID